MQWKDTSSVAGMVKKTAVCKRNMLYVWVLHTERNGWTQNEISQVKEGCCHQRLVGNQATETPSCFQKMEDYQRKHQVAIFYDTSLFSGAGVTS